MIPRILHHTWKNNELPEVYLGYQKIAKELHPDWEYRLWTDEDNLALVKNHFPHFLDIYNGLPKNIMRADMIRYMIMHQFGGVYLDLDYEMLKPFDLLQYDLVLPFNRQIAFGDQYDAFGNCIFGSAPGHPFWKLVLDDFSKHTDYETFFKSLSKEPYISRDTTLEEAITGPGLLSRIYFSYKDQIKDHYLPSREVFHPLNPRNEQEYEQIRKKGISYGIHHCTGTWRDKSLKNKIKMKLKMLLNIR